MCAMIARGTAARYRTHSGDSNETTNRRTRVNVTEVTGGRDRRECGGAGVWGGETGAGTSIGQSVLLSRLNDTASQSGGQLAAA